MSGSADPSTPSAALLGSPFRCFGIALAALVVAITMRVALIPWVGDRVPYVTVFGAVAVAVWLGGWLPGLAVAFLGFVAANLFIPGHPGTAPFGSPPYWLAALGFSLSAGLIVAFGVAMHRSRIRLVAEIEQRKEAEGELTAARAELEATLLSIGEGVIVTDRQDRVLTLNPVAESLTGWDAGAARGQPLATVFDIVDEEPGAVGANPTLLRSRNGTTRAIDPSASPIRGPQGLLGGVVLIFRDVSEQRQRDHENRRLAAELSESESVLRAMYEGSPLSMGVVELTDDDDILHLQDNARTCAIFGVPPGGTRNRRASELGAAPALIATWLRHYRDSATAGEPRSFSFELQTPTGLTRHRATVSPLKTGSSGRPRFTYITEDVTAQRAVDLVVRQTAVRAQLALEVAQVGLWSWNPAKDTVEADRRTREICSLPPEGALSLPALLPRIHGGIL